MGPKTLIKKFWSQPHGAQGAQDPGYTYLYIGVRGIPYGYIFSWARGMGMGDGKFFHCCHGRRRRRRRRRPPPIIEGEFEGRSP